MHYRLMLLSSTANRLPEDDQGADHDDLIEDGDEDEAGDGDDEDGDLDPDDDQDDEPDGEDEPPARQPSRGQNRIATLSASAKAEKERADRAEAALAEARRGPAQPQVSPEEANRRRDAHLATLTEAGRLEFLQRESEQRLSHRLDVIAFNAADASDKSAFAAMAARNPVLGSLEAEVETELAQIRAGGQNTTREAVATYLLGKKALAKAGRAKTKGAQRQAADRSREGARPMNGRGDVAPRGDRRTNDREARKKRLEGVSI